MKLLIDKLRGSGYAFFMGILGIMTLAEGLRLNLQSTLNKKWLLQPGSYIIIIGAALLLLTCFELFRWLKTRNLQESTQEVKGLAETQETQETHEIQETHEPVKAILVQWLEKNKRVLITLVCIGVYILIIPYVGMAIATIPFLIAVMRIMKNSKKAMAITILICFLFGYVLLPMMGISLPRGIIFPF